MDGFVAKTAIVTGGASGIGRALVQDLSRRGARVVVADLDLDGARLVGDEVGGTAARIDVTDAEAMRTLVENTARERGSIDLLFNNAGISIGGEARDMTATHWDRIVDVNVRGVVNGVRAAYPTMIEQGTGHIVNTASMAGLVPLPDAVAYATTKHAVVGLSTSLRIEAARHGVAVTVVCPGFVETALMRRAAPADLDVLASAPRTDRDDLPAIVGRPAAPEVVARDILDGVARNKAVVVTPRRFNVAWHVIRAAPATFMKVLGAIDRRAHTPDPRA